MIGIEALPMPQVIAALAAAALYVASYLSFVRLLRYPRNWCPPSLPASLATGVLAALTVALVALSPDRLDRPALAISVGFVVLGRLCRRRVLRHRGPCDRLPTGLPTGRILGEAR
jgi:hypothetical protein